MKMSCTYKYPDYKNVMLPRIFVSSIAFSCIHTFFHYKRTDFYPKD